MKKIIANPFFWVAEGCGIYRLKNSSSVAMLVERDGEKKILDVFFRGGYRCDGLSVPKPFRFFLKNWDDKNPLYNLAGAVHDALYGNKGFGILSRSECDDVFRGMLRESGADRKHASVADWCVGMFAGGHWGDDSLQCAHLASIDLH